jgi:hypothetical protein
MRRAWLLLACIGLAVAAGSALGRHAASPFPGLKQSELKVVTDSGTHRFTVWIADDDRSRERGLMYVRALPADRGMLFLFERPQYAAFWMKNTYLSLDLAFIAEDGVVTNVAHDATPLSLDPIASVAPVKGVLELVAGSARRIGLVAGSRIEHPAFAQP